MKILCFVLVLKTVLGIHWEDAHDTRWALNCDFFGNDLADQQTTGEQCGGRCEANPSCSHFTWTNHNGGTCWMKRGPVSEGQARDKNDQGAVCGHLKSRSGGGGPPPVGGAGGKLWGVAYSPWRSHSTCDIGDGQIGDDLSKIAGIAGAIRTYGMDCEFPEKVVRLTREKGLKLLLGLWVDGNDGTFQNQKSKLDQLLGSRPDLGHLIGISVGNEALMRGEQSEGALIGKINDIRGMVRGHGYNTPVTTVDVFDKYSHNLANNVDILVPNLHTFFANRGVDGSENIVFDLVGRLRGIAGGKTIIIGETGWPSGGSDGRANQENEWKFLKNFRCRADREGLPYFYFEAFNAKWKNLGDGNIESHWGLGDSERNFKGGLDGALQC